MPNFGPLFRNATNALQDAAGREFRRSDFGRLIEEVKRAGGTAKRAIGGNGNGRNGSGFSGLLSSLAASVGYKFDARRCLQKLMGADFGQLAKEVCKYHRRSDPLGQFMQSFLDSLGPAGELLRALSDPESKSIAGSLTAAKNLLRAFGWEPLPGHGATTEDWNRGIAASRNFLEALGYIVLAPAAEPSPTGRGRLPFGVSATGKTGQPLKNIRLPMGDNLDKFRRFPADHPIVTGAFVSDFQSDNVHSFGYDIENRYLYVRFRAKDSQNKPAGPGSLYRYSTVEPNLFLKLYNAPSKGTWVWDYLRERGTVVGHKRPYELVGVMGGYVPRRVTFRAGGEYFEKRKVHIGGGRYLESSMPDQLVSAWSRGTPNRGKPNRAKANSGRP